MDDFLERFFPAVFAKKHEVKENNYCKYDNQFLQLFTSSLYLAALVASFTASRTCTKYGRKRTMLMASLLFLVGVASTAGAINLAMLITGRILLGIGVGFANQVRYIYISFFRCAI
jgi:MFS transporter, SP family, sugar:H+ symporter